MPGAYLLFEIANATYAVPSEMVAFVEMIEKITWVPNAPDFVEGVVSLRGQIIPVISVRKRFHMEPAPVNVRTRLLVIRLKERLIGMMVDTAREFARIQDEAMLPPPETVSGRIVQYLDGVIQHKDRLILVVNLEQLFSEPDQSAISSQQFVEPDTA